MLRELTVVGLCAFYAGNLQAQAYEEPSPAPHCERQNPALSFEAPMSRTSGLGPAFYTLNITNQDSADCPSSVYSLSAAVTHPTLQTSLQHAAIVVAPGATAQTQMTVTPSQYLMVGQYYISVTAKNVNAASFLGSATATLEYLASPCLFERFGLTGEPTMQSVRPGGQAMFALTTRNNNRGDCGEASVGLLVDAPEGFKGAMEPNLVQLRPGDSTTSVFIVTVPANAEPGDYTVVATTKAPHDIYQASAEFTVRVQAN